MLAGLWADLTTTTFETVTAGWATARVAPATKFVPVSVTGTVLPRMPLVGLIEVSVGAGGVMLNADGGDVPPGVVTVTFTDPAGAAAPMTKLAVTCVALTTETLLT